MSDELEFALRRLERVREEREKALDAYNAREIMSGPGSDDAEDFHREKVDPHLKAVAPAEAAVLAAQCATAEDVLRKLVALMDEDGLIDGASERLRQDAAAFIDASSTGKSVPASPAARAALIAETLAVQPPKNLLADDGAPSDEMLAFCRETGASLDFIFCGDLRGMIRQRQRAEAQTERQGVTERLYQVQSLIRCAMVAEENETSGLEWKGIPAVLGVAEELLHNAINTLEVGAGKKPTLHAAE